MKSWELSVVLIFLSLFRLYAGGDPIMLKYARDGDAGGLESAFGGLGGNINCRDTDGQTPLMIAAQFNDWIHFDTLKTAIKLGANVNLTDNQGHTAYFYAKKASNQQAMDYLVEKGADPNIQGAAKNGSGAGSGVIDSVKNLFSGTSKKEEVKPEPKISVVPSTATSPSNTAATSPSAPSSNGPSKIEITSEESTLPSLIDTVKMGNIDHIKRVLADIHTVVNLVDQNGWSALMYAVQLNQSEIVKLLLDRDANVNSKDPSGWSSLLLAANNGNLSIVEMLLSKGAEINGATGKGTTALIIASGRGHAPVVQRLIEANALLAARDQDGKNALQYAMEKNHPDVAELLKKAGATP
jgi:ankyrin repeat protein